MRWEIRPGATNLRTRAIILAVCATLALGLTLNWHLRRSVAHEELDRLSGYSFQVARDLADRARDLILTDNHYLLVTLLDDTRRNVDDVIYILVLDTQGRLIASSTDWGGPPSADLAAIGPGPEPRQAALDTERGRVYDTAYPLLGGTAGTVRVGMSTDRMQATLSALSRSLALGTALATAVAVAVAALLTGLVTRPMEKLIRAARAVTSGDLSISLPESGGNEMAEVARSFNVMTGALRDARRRNAEIHTLRSQLLERVISAQEDERRRIAAELHDQTGQLLTSITRELGAIASGQEHTGTRRRIEDVRTVAAETLDQVRRLSYNLRPPVLDDLGLVPALKRCLDEAETAYGISTDLWSRGMERRLPPDAETALYRVAQEALANVGRHAQATSACIILERAGSQVRLIIEDDGVGFDLRTALAPDGSGRGLGLLGMRERMSAIHGRLTVETGPGNGTTVYARVRIEGDQEVGDCDDRQDSPG